MNKEITIIIPVYNGEKFIERCLDSVLAQTLKNFIVVVIDDGSRDNSLDILRQYEENNPEYIRVYSQENMGVAKTRNKGIELSETKYLMFIDQDDYIEYDFCEKHYTKAEEGGYDIVLSGFKRPDAGRRIINKYVPLREGPYARYVCTGLWAKLHKTEFVKKNNIKVFHTKYGEDIAFVLNEYSMTDNMKVLEGYVGYNWSYNTESVSNTSQKKVLDMLPPHLVLLDKIRQYDKKGSIEHQYYILQTVVFYLLWTGQLAKKSDFMYAYKEVFRWLEANYPSFQKNRYILFGPREAPFLNRVAISGLMMAHKLNLMPAFAAVYCRQR